MDSKHGFYRMTPSEFETWIVEKQVARTILYVQQHHTYRPDYSNFRGNNHFQMQQGMKNHHVVNNGWRDIGQHFSIYPDGMIVTGRSLESSPACIYMNNANSVCIENIGYFDEGHDEMTDEQKESIIRVTAAICRKFDIPVNTDKIVYHHWFNLSTGERNNGAGGNKTCPGTRFFGGNKVEDCEQHFLPLISASLANEEPDERPIPRVSKYVSVTATRLNVRTGNSTQFSLAPDREAAEFGSVLRVYEERNGWYRISSSKQHWVYGRYAADVERYSVRARRLNIRNGPSMQSAITGSLSAGQDVFVFEKSGEWAKIALDESWVSLNFLEQGR